MLDIKSLLAKLVYSIGTEPLITSVSTVISQIEFGGHCGYMGSTGDFCYLHNGRIGCGMSNDGTTVWFINSLSPYEVYGQSPTFGYNLYYLVEVFTTKNFTTGSTGNGTSGGTYYGYTDYSDMTSSAAQAGLVLDTAPSNLTSGIDDSYTWTLMCRGSWGCYAHSSATAQINCQACSNLSNPMRIMTHNRSTSQTGGYPMYIYGVALWGVTV